MAPTPTQSDGLGVTITEVDLPEETTVSWQLLPESDDEGAAGQLGTQLLWPVGMAVVTVLITGWLG